MLSHSGDSGGAVSSTGIGPGIPRYFRLGLGTLLALRGGERRPLAIRRICFGSGISGETSSTWNSKTKQSTIKADERQRDVTK